MEYSYTKKIDTYNDYGYLEFFIKNLTFQLYSSHNYSSSLHIIKSKESKEEVDVADCFMEFILFLYKLNIDWFYPKKINFIDYNNITITNKDVKTLLFLSEIALSNDRENKDYRFYNCVIKKDAILGILPCEDNGLLIDESIIEDFHSLNSFAGDQLLIRNSIVQEYTDIVTLHCRYMELTKVNMNFSLFFAKTQAKELEKIKVFNDSPFSETDLAFLPNLYNLWSLRTYAHVDNTASIDKLKKLFECFGVYKKQKDNKYWNYLPINYRTRDKKNNKTIIAFLEDEEYEYWKNEVKESNPKIIKENALLELTHGFQIKESLTSNEKGYPDIRFLLESGLIKLTSTERYEFNLENCELEKEKGIEYYKTDGIYIPGKQKNQSNDEVLFQSVHDLLSPRTTMTLFDFKDGKITSTIIDEYCNFNINDSLTSDNINEIIRQTEIAKQKSSTWEIKTMEKQYIKQHLKNMNRSWY